MSSNDYGGYAYRNGVKILDRSDVTLGAVKLQNPDLWGNVEIPQNSQEPYHHGVTYRFHLLLGDGPVYLSFVKHYPGLYNLNQFVNLPSRVDRPWRPGLWGGTTYIDIAHGFENTKRFIHKFEGYKITIHFLYDPYPYAYAQLEQPDGTIWAGFAGQQVGAGFEGAVGYGGEESDKLSAACEKRLWEIFGHPRNQSVPSI